MNKEIVSKFGSTLDKKEYEKLIKIDNSHLHQSIAQYIELCNPKSVFVCNDSPEDYNYIKEAALKNGEEIQLSISGHTAHFDSFDDQARDRGNTKILLKKGVDLGPMIQTKDRDEGLSEIHTILKDIMQGKELYVCFFCLGPTNSPFSIPAVQLTDSSFVAHNEILLYRPGYKEFIKQSGNDRFFKFVHSQGELDARNVSKNLDERRIYIDIDDYTVYSANTQYGGNSIGLKKLAMRLAIKLSSQEGWLTEHMLIAGVKGPNDRTTYFTGAFPSLCGKTSTAMMEGETIVGDDIAYLKKNDNDVRAVNVEKGMFGIIQGVNSKDDPIIWKTLNNPAEIIFSNVLITPEKHVHWIGRDGQIPPKGNNHSGAWEIGKKDENGKEITCSHPNARFTLSLSSLDNMNPNIDNPQGVVVEAIVYGGRDSDTSVPVEEAFDWTHGIITKGASLESETTAATLGKTGERKFNPMSNLDFISIPIGTYIQNNIDFANDLNNPPRIFSVNYFLRDGEGQFLNSYMDKRIWYKWMELRVHSEVTALDTPTGRIPVYEDLQRLFSEVLNKEYSEEDYNQQFMIRIPENLAKIERITAIYEDQISDVPKILFDILEQQKSRLTNYQKAYSDYILPSKTEL